MQQGMPVDKIRRVVKWEPGMIHAVDVLTGNAVELSPRQIETMAEEYRFGFIEGPATYRPMYQPDGFLRWTIVPFEQH